MIIAFPNLCFYNGQLQNGEIVTSKKYSHVFYESDYFHVFINSMSIKIACCIL